MLSGNVFRTTGLQLKLLILIKSPNIFHWKNQEKNKVGVVLGKIKINVVKKVKETGIINMFFSYFAWGIHFKEGRSGCANT